jgi:hypothetical protein
MSRTKVGGTLWVVAGLAGLILAVSAAGPATADGFDTACATPSNPVIPPSPTTAVTLAAGQTLVIAGTYQGGLNAFPAGSQVCVGAGATFAPPYMNNAAGAVFNRGTITFPGLAVAAGFRVDNSGAVTFGSNINTNGAAALVNGAAGSMTFSQSTPLNNGSTLTNDGQVNFASDFSTDNGTTVTNRGTLSVAGNFIPNGTVQNSGRLIVSGSLTTNSQALVTNACTLILNRDLINNADLRTSGVILAATGGSVTNQGTLSLDVTGTVVGGSFTNNRQVNGAGRLYFTGTTLNQGAMSGTSAAAPLVFYDTTLTGGGVVDTNNGTLVNVIRQTFTPPDASTVSPGCANAGADVVTTETGPATVVAGTTMTYTVSVSDKGPQDAAGVTIIDSLPPGVTVVSPGGGTVGAGTVTWVVPTIPTGTSQTFSLTVSVPAGATGTLVNVVASTASTTDPDPTNNDGSSSTARVSTTVTPAVPPNTPPSAVDQTVETRADLAAVGALGATDPDPGQTLTWTATPVQTPASGTVTIDPTGRFSYQPAPGFTGIVIFVAQVCDNGTPVACATATVTVVVTPVAVDDSATTTVGTPVTITVAANDTGPAGPPALGTPPPNGTVVVNADGTVTYTPGVGFTGVDTFAYQICAPSAPAACDTAVVTVTVTNPPNLPPVVGDAVAATTAGVAVAFDLPASDPDTGQSVTFQPTAVSGPQHGTVAIAPNGTAVYTPTDGFTGIDSFVGQGCDNGTPSLCATGTATITVSPVAVNDVVTTPLNQPVTVPVKDNDVGDTGLPTIVAGPANGAAVVNGDGTVTYTPNAGFAGGDSLRYQVCSPTAPTVCDSAQVIVSVQPAPDGPPNVNDEVRTIKVNTVLSLAIVGVDSHGQADLTFDPTAASGPTNGTAIIAADGSVTYTPGLDFTGIDSFTVRACVTTAPTNCATGTVTVTVTPVARDVAISTVPGTPVVANIVFNDSGTVGPPTIIVPPTVGGFVINPDRTLTFTPDPNFTGVVTMRYQICSPTAATVCDSATVTIYVSPLAVDDQALTGAQQAVQIQAGANDSGDADAIDVVAPPQSGTVSAAPDGVFTYTPSGTFTGVDTFTYSRCNVAAGLCTSAAVTVTIVPDAQDDEATTTSGHTVVIDVLANDIGDNSGPTILTPPSNGTAVDPPATVTYTPDAGFVGVDAFRYQICSPSRIFVCASASVMVTVSEVPNQPPALTAPAVRTVQDTSLSGVVTATDPEGQAVTFDTLPLDGPAHGTVTIAADGTFTYTPVSGFVGADAFVVQACDTAGGCSTAIVQVTVEPLVASPPPPTTVTPTIAPPSREAPTAAPPSPPVTLPRTGTPTARTVGAALLAATAGLALLALTRRRAQQ